ncbi:hypothetical protein P691DRAFT_734653 [Macrolepiota fuliginosa MF-IS2]|uniref:Protein kinase domain-containing protein n=1 Tax=Macrolepiota fuliginosa MF-IS2 TaxID=1400762 RepID=A0A9P5X7Q6_9AGAR|nr:hypothetical protein P691DRAFT_734653 [Macrolepiota fuliginosa MF-IS2]
MTAAASASSTPNHSRPYKSECGRELTDTRIAIATEMDTEMLLCNVESFQQSYLPFIPTAEDIDSCVQLICDNGLLVKKDTDSLQWRDFPKPPSRLSGTGKVVFSPLKAIVDVISRHKFTGDRPGRVNVPRVEYRDCPNANVHSELCNATFNIDGCFELGEGGGLEGQGTRLAASNIAISAVLKKNEKDWVDNRQKLVSAASHIMNDDPRRAFVFGFTIEDDKMALWYFSRSHSTKSKDFNFIQDYKQLISVFISFIFTDEAGLGYDPIVHRSAVGDITYTYEIPVAGATRYFKSTGTLSSYRSLGVTGHMTRVWKAIEVSSPGGRPIPGKKEVALKDVWLEDDATPEKAIQDAIFAEVKKQRNLRDNGQPSRLDLVMKWRIKIDFEKVIKGDEYQKYFPTVTQDRSTAPRSYRPKRRYIVVYSEICTAFHDAVNLKTSFKALEGALIALVILFIAGWLHRDVSTGNILVFVDEETVTGKLSDLEYAKEFSLTIARSDPKTGTPYFMAYELLTGVSFRKSQPLDVDFAQKIWEGKVISPEQCLTQSSAAPLGVVCNFQHDLESLFWIALWILLARVDYQLLIPSVCEAYLR